MDKRYNNYMDYTIRKTVAFLAGMAITFNLLSVDDIGAVNDVSLQAPEMEITTAEPVDFVPSAYIVSNSQLQAEARRYTDDLDARTITVSLEDGEDDALGADEFTYDGNHYWVSVDIANLGRSPIPNPTLSRRLRIQPMLSESHTVPNGPW